MIGLASIEQAIDKLGNKIHKAVVEGFEKGAHIIADSIRDQDTFQRIPHIPPIPVSPPMDEVAIRGGKR